MYKWLVLVVAVAVVAGSCSTIPRVNGYAKRDRRERSLREGIPALPPEKYYAYRYHALGYPDYRRYQDMVLNGHNPRNEHDLLSKEIDRIAQMGGYAKPMVPFQRDMPQGEWPAEDTYFQRILDGPGRVRNRQVWTPRMYREMLDERKEQERPISIEIRSDEHSEDERFAFSPIDYEYYSQHDEYHYTSSAPIAVTEVSAKVALEPPRQSRQNPNLSKSKTLLSDLDKTRFHDGSEIAKQKNSPNQVQVLEAPPTNNILGVTVIAAVAALLLIAIVGLFIGWHTLSRRAKAAADVDYPAYGVTGPTIDKSGDRKLAQSAHMYHYQHQKQQIIAMERSGLERNGSISDPESEEENEEGDYTVYECPGFATTGDMEVKNPLFSDDPTPATPAKVDNTKAKE